MLNTHHFTNKANPISPLQHRINKAIETRDFWARRLEHKQDMSLRQKLASEMILLSLDRYVNQLYAIQYGILISR